MKYLIIFSVLILCSCKSSSTAQKQYMMLSMQKTSCFGACPEYVVEISNTGDVFYTGKSNVPREGEVRFTLKETDLDLIKSNAEALQFFELKDRYHADVTDLPTVILKYNDGANQKTVIDYYNAPEKLKEFESQVESIIFEYL